MQGLWEVPTQTKFTPSIQSKMIYEKRGSFVGAEHQWFLSSVLVDYQP
jgi:hypothetical protein